MIIRTAKHDSELPEILDLIAKCYSKFCTLPYGFTYQVKLNFLYKSIE